MNFIRRRSIKKCEKCSICGGKGHIRTRAAGIGFHVEDITCDECERRGTRQAGEERIHDVLDAGWASIMALG